MTSSVFFKFKSQKEPSRVSFDGTGISVFELKREIINKSRLGDGTDFELAIYNEDTNEEYDDDTSIIPRSTSIIARRLPASRPGKGGAARYISGKMPVGPRSTSRAEPHTAVQDSNSVAMTSGLDNPKSEDEKIKALFSLQESQWREQQQELSSVPFPSSRGRAKPTNVPDHPPPPGYLCYRCREKGHWIQACPTNNDPKFDGRYRVKRSTGIPRSFQKTVEKPDSLNPDGLNENSTLSGVMVNADGDFVIAQPDKASWELYQEKAKASLEAASGIADAGEAKELGHRGLLCPIDRRVLLAPTKTPCCQTTYCNDCISNALIDSDFVCPNCGAEGVLLDDLSVDEGAITKLKAYEAEKTAQNKNTERTGRSDPHQSTEDSTGAKTAAPSGATAGQKRAASETLEKGEGGDVLAAPSIKKQRSQDGSGTTPGHSSADGPDVSNMFTAPQFNQSPFQNFVPPMNAPMLSNPLTGPPFAPFLGNAGLGNGPPLSSGGDFTAAWNQSPAAGFMPPQGLPYMNVAGTTAGYGGTGGGMADTYFPQQYAQPAAGIAPFSNQQRTSSSAPFAKEEDNAYFRQPVNPHRHQARQRRVRPSDYREL